MSNSVINLFIVAGILILIGLFVWWRIGRVKPKKINVTKTTIYSIAELNQLHANAISKGTSGTILVLCEVKGVAEIEKPLIAPESNTHCVAYDLTIEQVYRDSKGSTKRNLAYYDKKAKPFWLCDQSGRIKVYPQEAEIEFVETVNRNSASLNYSYSTQLFQSGEDTGNYHCLEQCIPLNTNLCILGRLRNLEGEVALVPPIVKIDRPFITLPETNKPKKAK
jgi:E3 Ubiquitin ligase